MPFSLLSSFLDAQGNFPCLALSSEVVPQPIRIAVGLSGTPMLICACVLHAVCLGIFLVVGLGLRALCWLALSVACFVLVGLRPRAQLPDAPTPNGAHGMYIYVLEAFLLLAFGARRLVDSMWWLLVAGYAVLTHD